MSAQSSKRVQSGECVQEFRGYFVNFAASLVAFAKKMGSYAMGLP